MRKTVAVDIDGVLADYSMGWKDDTFIGEPIPGAVEFTHELAKFADVLIFTTRCCEEVRGKYRSVSLARKFIQEWLDKHGFKYHEIWVGQGKPIAAAYIDDRAVPCRPQDDATQAELVYKTASNTAALLCGEALMKDST
jgi:hypothetical protein